MSQPGKMPTKIVKTTAAAIARPIENGIADGLVGIRRIADPHRHHDPQIEERCHDRGQHGDDRDGVAVDFDRGLDDAELGDEAARERHAGLGEQEDGERQSPATGGAWPDP